MPKIAIFSFFCDILPRGISGYINDMCALSDEACQIQKILISPKLKSKSLEKILFVLTEQFLAPIYLLFFPAVVFPYNSAPILGSLLLPKRCWLVVHDTICFERRSLAAWYQRFCIKFHNRRSGSFIFISESSRDQFNERLYLSNSSKSVIIPNSCIGFSRKIKALEGDLDSPGDEGNPYVILFSGTGHNKDLGGAISLWLNSDFHNKYDLKIIGLQDAAPKYREYFSEKLRNFNSHIDFIEFLDDLSLLHLLRSSLFIWSHSKSEGFGRPVYEAQLIGKACVCSRIPAHVEQANIGIFYYELGSVAEFNDCIQMALTKDIGIITARNLEREAKRQLKILTGEQR